MKKKNKAVKITLTVGRDIFSDLVEELIRLGINSYYTEPGRSAIIEEKKGMGGYLTKEELVDYPVDSLFFFVEKKLEDLVIGHLAGKYDLYSPGRGTIFSSDIVMVDSHPSYIANTDLDKSLFDEKAHLFKELAGLCCIIQRGLAEGIARTCLESGVGSPWITFGVGGGMRDTLGLLRIAIPAEKELVNVVVSKYDIDTIMEMIIEKGRVFDPGKGFIYQYAIKQGLVNTRIKKGASGQVASTEQIIAAIDSIKGNLKWRKSRLESNEYQKHFFLKDLTELCLICNAGSGGELMRKTIAQGSTGATISKVTYFTEIEEKKTSAGREVCRMIVPNKLVDKIAGVLEDTGVFSNEMHGQLYTLAVPKAFTYRR